MTKEKYFVFTDGSSHPIEKSGGWAFIVAEEKSSKEEVHKAYGYGGNETTNNRMELIAVINSLHYAYVNGKNLKYLTIFTDSQYVSNPIYFGWLKDWRDKNWVNLNGAKTKNADLWEDMHQILKKYKFRGIGIDILWVRGHNGNKLNELADRLANKARKNKVINEVYEQLSDYKHDRQIARP